MNTSKILLIEDEEQVRHLLREWLTRAGYEVKAAATGRDGLVMLDTGMFDIALIDIHLPDMTGIEVLKSAKLRDMDMDAVIMTGYPGVETAVQALRLGAYDYLIKPLDWKSLKHVFKRIIERRSQREEVTSLRARLEGAPPMVEFIGCSRPIQEIKETVAKVAPTGTAVLIEGESGTGKELIAGALHQLSSRSHGPLVPVNCAAIPSELMESELFGHQKGAFSGASADSRGLFRSADGGTSPQGGKCTIATSAHPGQVVLMVHDTGCGMSTETRARAFEPFFTTHGLPVASGLGLSTVYGIVRQHGGTIDLSSKLGCGTTFSIAFPALS